MEAKSRFLFTFIFNCTYLASVLINKIKNFRDASEASSEKEMSEKPSDAPEKSEAFKGFERFLK